MNDNFDVSLTCGKIGSPRERIVGGVRVVQPKIVLGSWERLGELDDVADVFGRDRSIGGRIAKRRVVVQPINHALLAQTAWNVDDELCGGSDLKKN